MHSLPYLPYQEVSLYLVLLKPFLNLFGRHITHSSWTLLLGMLLWDEGLQGYTSN